MATCEWQSGTRAFTDGQDLDVRRQALLDLGRGGWVYVDDGLSESNRDPGPVCARRPAYGSVGSVSVARVQRAVSAVMAARCPLRTGAIG